MLRIRLLGGFEIRHGEEALPLQESSRARSLLAYLVLHDDAPQPRQHLAFVLWPDSNEGQARTNLRHVLHNLRRVLPDADRFLETTSQTLRWRSDAPYWLDVAAFEDALASADAADDDVDGEVAALREALVLYAGDLLGGSYDEWLFAERERLHHRHLDALHRLTVLLTVRGEHAEAVHVAQELLRCDPLREESYRVLMRAHEAAGDQARAVRRYHACATTLQRELGVEPSATTTDIYAALTRGPPAAETEPSPGRPGGPPLVGRDEEWEVLTGCWSAVERGGASLVVVAGEAGVGKSRLVDELRTWCAHRGAVVADARSYPAEGELGYGALTAWLRTAGLAAGLRRLDRAETAELARLLPELVTATGAMPEPLTESEHRHRLFDAVAHVVLVPGQATLLVIDDAQWCDRSTLQLVHYLLRLETNGRLLVVATVRREELGDEHAMDALVRGAHALDRCTEIELGRLSAAETAELAVQLTAGSIGGADLDRLYGETEGNPLFVVETVRAGWDVGVGDRPVLTPKLHAVVTARLAQLSAAARQLVGVAASVGRDFTSDVVAGAADLDGATMARALDELWRRGIVHERGMDEYDFTHDKIREVAYFELGAAQRRHHHRRLAATLLQLHPDPAPVSGQLAGHYERSGELADAITWYTKAAEQSQRRHANDEAVRLLDRALDLAAELADDDRRTRELAVLSALPTPLAAVEGFGSSRLAETQQRAAEAAEALGVEPGPPLLRSRAMSHLSRGEFDEARRVGARLQLWGQRQHDDALLVEGDYVLGIAAFWDAAFADAGAHFERALGRARPEHRAALLRYGQDPEVACQGRLGNTRCFLGDADGAIRASDAAVALAEVIGHPNTRDTALTFAALLAVDLGDADRCRRHVAALEVGTDVHRWRHVGVTVEAFAGYIDVLDGAPGAGIARVRRAIDQRWDLDLVPGQGAVLARVLLAAHEVAGDVDGGLVVADDVLARGGSPVWEAETRRLRAEFMAQLGASPVDVEAELTRAMDVARRQGAVTLQERIARSRAHLSAG